MPRALQVVVEIHEVPDDENPMRPAYRLAMGQSWIINGEPQPCDDPLVVLSALRQATDMIMRNVPFRPPSVLQVPPGAVVPPIN